MQKFKNSPEAKALLNSALEKSAWRRVKLVVSKGAL
jgi:hypothetical protein